MNCSTEKIERKIKIILTQFFREVKKENAMTASDRKYKSKWFLYPALEYLKEAGHRMVDCSANDDSINAVIVSLDDSEDLKNEEDNVSIFSLLEPLFFNFVAYNRSFVFREKAVVTTKTVQMVKI